MATTFPSTIVSGSGIKGDITRCKIENQVLKVERNSAFSLTEKKTMVSYDVCSKEILETYTLPQFASFSVVYFFIAAFIVIGALSVWAGSGRDRW